MERLARLEILDRQDFQVNQVNTVLQERLVHQVHLVQVVHQELGVPLEAQDRQDRQDLPHLQVIIHLNISPCFLNAKFENVCIQTHYRIAWR